MSDIDLQNIKKIKKKKVSYSIRENLIEEFNHIASEKGYNKSSVVEEMLKIFIEKEKSLI